MHFNAFDYAAILFFCLLYSLVFHELESAIQLSTIHVSVSNNDDADPDSLPISFKRKEVSTKNEDGMKPFISDYDRFRPNMSSYDRILYVQRNYHQFDSEERKARLFHHLAALNQANNCYPRDVVFQNMPDTGLGNNLLALASSFIVSRFLNASFHGEALCGC